MRPRRPIRALSAFFVLGAVCGIGIRAGTSSAANYQLIADAHCDGASTLDVGVDQLAAFDVNPDGGGGANSETYEASASNGGALSASASSVGVPPFSVCSDRAVARITETVHLSNPFPSGPVAITVGMVASPVALAQGGSVARASAQVQLEPFGINCTAGISTNGGPSGSCSDGSVAGLSVTRTFSLTELGSLQWEVDVAAQVDATLELFSATGAASSSASGALYVMVGGGVESYTWTGTNTNIPTPEPGAALLAATAFASLAAVRRRRR